MASSAISPLGLAGLSVLTLRYTHEEMRRCLAVLADPEAYPVLVHCTQGKDRTGVVVIVVEMLLGARAEAIEREYLLSNEGLEEVLEVMVGELRERGLGGEFAVAEEGVVAAVVAELRSVGGVGAYVGRCGVGEKEVETLRAVLAGGL